VRRLLLTVACLTALLSLAAPVLANGAPIKIPLSKLSGVVNFGAEQSSGLAEITAVEGDVVVQVVDLQRLNNELYQAWLVNTKNGERLSVGKFNSTGDGTARTQVVVQIGNREFDLFVITVEPEPDTSPNEDARIVLAGYWPGRAPGAAATAVAATIAAGGTPPPTPPAAAGAGTPTAAPPTGLPRTGGFGFEVLFGALGVLGAGLFIVGRGVKR
jgi:hypothetical protein